MLEAADAFELMLRSPVPDAMLLANLRLRVTVPNGRRRMILERIYATLGTLPPADAERIRQIRSAGVDAVVRSSNHIAIWTAREVMRNWPGYVAASIDVPNSIRSDVRTEERFIYPLLTGNARRTA